MGPASLGQRTLVSCALVNTHWNAAASSILWKRLDMGDSPIRFSNFIMGAAESKVYQCCNRGLCNGGGGGNGDSSAPPPHGPFTAAGHRVKLLSVCGTDTDLALVESASQLLTGLVTLELHKSRISPPSYRLLSRLPGHFPQLRSLIADVVPASSWNAWMDLCATCPHLQNLHISFSEGDSHEFSPATVDMDYVFSRIPNLHVLSLWRVPLPDDEVILKVASHCPNLRAVKLDDCGDVSMNALVILWNRCTKFESLVMRRVRKPLCFGALAKAFGVLPGGGGEDLTSVYGGSSGMNTMKPNPTDANSTTRWSNPTGNDEGFSILSHRPTFRTLIFDSCMVSDILVSELTQRAPNLEYLYIEEDFVPAFLSNWVNPNPQLQPHNPADPYQQQQPQQLYTHGTTTNSDHTAYIRVSSVTNSGIDAMISNTHRLRIVSIIGFLPSLPCFIKVLQSNPDLIGVNFARPSLARDAFLNDEFCLAIAPYMKNVRGLELYSQWKFSESALLAVLANAPELRHLGVANCEQVTDRVLDAMPLLCPRLKRLDVSRTRVTRGGLMRFFEHARELRECVVGDLQEIVMDVDEDEHDGRGGTGRGMGSSSGGGAGPSNHTSGNSNWAMMMDSQSQHDGPSPYPSNPNARAGDYDDYLSSDIAEEEEEEEPEDPLAAFRHREPGQGPGVCFGSVVRLGGRWGKVVLTDETLTEQTFSEYGVWEKEVKRVARGAGFVY
ncbi:hypothetical protein HK102_008377 [Quaeritorhiza haematococci]|nr:hypothetical protein HK102_008377 [Quaeritorhiza haematococci]